MSRMLVMVVDLDNSSAAEHSVQEDAFLSWLRGEITPDRFDGEEAFAEWLSANRAFLGCDEPRGWYSTGDIPGDVYSVALCTARSCHVDQVDALARYFFEGPFAGEYYGLKSPDVIDGWGRLFILNADFTKSRHDDWGDSITGLWEHLQIGSPVRKTNRSGVGTKGTRAVDGLHCDLWVAFA